MSAKFLEVSGIYHIDDDECLRNSYGTKRIINANEISFIVPNEDGTADIVLDCGDYIKTNESYYDIRRMLCGDSG